jgi:hypothetical protein
MKLNEFVNLTDQEKAVIAAIGDKTYTVPYIERSLNFRGSPEDLTEMQRLHAYGSSAFLRAIRGMLRLQNQTYLLGRPLTVGEIEGLRKSIDEMGIPTGLEAIEAPAKTKWEKEDEEEKRDVYHNQF